VIARQRQAVQTAESALQDNAELRENSKAQALRIQQLEAEMVRAEAEKGKALIELEAGLRTEFYKKQAANEEHVRDYQTRLDDQLKQLQSFILSEGRLREQVGAQQVKISEQQAEIERLKAQLAELAAQAKKPAEENTPIGVIETPINRPDAAATDEPPAEWFTDAPQHVAASAKRGKRTLHGYKRTGHGYKILGEEPE